MKNISLASIFEKNRLVSDKAWLIALKIDIRDPNTNFVVDQLRVIRNDEITTINGEEYQPFPFSISTVESVTNLPSVTIDIEDQTRIVQSYLQRYGGGVGSDVEIIIVCGDGTAVYSDPELCEYFQIIKASSKSYAITWTLGAENPLTQPFPLRRQESNQCSFRYRTPECGYVGELETCDLTLGGENGCRVHKNAINYGGCPGLAS